MLRIEMGPSEIEDGLDGELHACEALPAGGRRAVDAFELAECFEPERSSFGQLFHALIDEVTDPIPIAFFVSENSRDYSQWPCVAYQTGGEGCEFPIWPDESSNPVHLSAGSDSVGEPISGLSIDGERPGHGADSVGVKG